MKPAYKPKPSDFQRLVEAINRDSEHELEAAIGTIAKDALAAKRKLSAKRAIARKPKMKASQ